VQLCEAHGRPVATPQQARQLLGLTSVGAGPRNGSVS
jgi:hypothetical protein